MSSVSSENLTWSEQDPTIKTSCSVSVIIGDFSTGGVINGLSLAEEFFLPEQQRIFQLLTYGTAQCCSNQNQGR